jgi:hypothetical protein
VAKVAQRAKRRAHEAEHMLLPDEVAEVFKLQQQGGSGGGGGSGDGGSSDGSDGSDGDGDEY